MPNMSRAEIVRVMDKLGDMCAEYVPNGKPLQELAHKAIAALEAEQEPVFKIMHGPKGSDGLPEYVEFMSLTDADHHNFPHGTELFTAPPAQAAAVPDDDAGYDLAIEHMDEGLSALLDALGVDAEFFDRDEAAASAVNAGLKEIAAWLKPLNARFSEDVESFVVAAPAPAEKAITLSEIDAAFEQEIAGVSTLEYNSNEICRTFYGKLRDRLAPATPVTGEAG